MTVTLRRLSLSAAAFTLVFAVTVEATAQTRGGRDAARGRDAAGSARKRQSEAELQRKRERREAAAVLIEVADAARSLADASMRVQLLAEVADALWPQDAQGARSILRGAWEVTIAPGALEAFEPEPEDDARFDASDFIISARQTVINVAAKHDPPLAETYMRDMRHGLAEEDNEVVADGDEEGVRPRDAWREPSVAGRRRLETAHELINLGEYAGAARIAAPVVAEGVTRSLLEFILRLRPFDATAADALYLRLLERTRADASSDANDVLLLATPIVSPDLHAYVGGGSIHFAQPIYRDQLVRREPPAGMPPEIRRAFFDTAAAVLARNVALRDGSKRPGGDSAAYYFAAGRLLPFVERETPQHAPRLRALMAARSSDLSEARREDFAVRMKTRSLSPSNPTDPLRFELEELKRARDDEARDRLRLNGVYSAAHRRLWDGARQFAAGITDGEMRSAAFSLIAVNQVKYIYEAFERDKDDAAFEKAAAFVRAADVPPAARALGLLRAAELAASRGGTAQASELFDEAMTQAAQVEKGTGTQVLLFALLVDAASRFNREHAWTLLSQLTVAANEWEGPARSECMGIAVPARADVFCIPLSEKQPGLPSVYARMVELNATRALEEARALKDEAERSFALAAVARAIIRRSETVRGGAR